MHRIVTISSSEPGKKEVDRIVIPRYDTLMASSKQNNSLKKLLKSVMSELIEENEELVRRIFEDAIEDAFLTKAIKDGRRSRKVSRDRIFRALSTQA